MHMIAQLYITRDKLWLERMKRPFFHTPLKIVSRKFAKQKKEPHIMFASEDQTPAKA